MIRLRKLAAAIACCFLLAIFLTGCASNGADSIFRYDLDQEVTNLDPQFATEDAAHTVIYNIYEGLFRQLPDGSLAYGAALSHTLSEDQLTYTFQLNPQAVWADGTALTANDFVFALRRLFSPSSPSPYAQNYLSIEGAEEILAGKLTQQQLGVSALDSHTLEIRLRSPSPFFLEYLSNSAAMPCQETFFQQSKGRYGLEKAFIMGNGPFTLERWATAKPLQLRKNAGFQSQLPVTAGGINLYVGRTDPVAQFLSGQSDLITLDAQALSRLSNKNAAVTPVEKTVWCLVFNQNVEGYSNTLIRQGFAQGMDRSAFTPYFTTEQTSTSLFLPASIGLGGKSYRSLTTVSSPMPFNSQRSSYLFELGLETAGLDKLPKSILFVPDSGSHSMILGMAQQSWQKNLSAYINVKNLPANQLWQRYETGNYQILLLPFSSNSSEPKGFLGQFASDSPKNFSGYQNPLYDLALSNAFHANTLEEAVKYYRQCELMLLSDGVIIPLYSETSYQAYAEGVSGIEAFPFGGKIYFAQGTKK
ncbi:peptide ABC transporter substrate-binding protein [Oscillospiraceae bacterium MB08-C2-2]|nr:peptide ABC transporter substrate-binding protein [Oscillospiraceae bacterium MB08-C2-2]